MTVAFGLWRLGDKADRIDFTAMPNEARLEDLVISDPAMIGLDLLVIARQVTAYNTRLDILAMDVTGDLHVIELKRDKTPRDAVAQLLDYGSWVRDLGHEELGALHQAYANRALEESFAERFATSLPDDINSHHHLVLVASELDAPSERIISYLSSEWGLPVNVVFFRYFVDGEREYLARTWLIEPQIVEDRAATSRSGRKREPWNGHDFYVALGEDERRTWEACRRYGFISAGGGEWYTKTLQRLFVGSRVFVYIPKTGYVGVGSVIAPVAPVSDVEIDVGGSLTPLVGAPGVPPGIRNGIDDPELAEQVVRVEWIATRDATDAVREKGMFANQNTVCELRSRFTLDRLIEAFELEE